MDTNGGSDRFDLEVTVNGRVVRANVPTTLRLLDFLRDELRLTGAKEVCGEGECGACTVILDGETVNSCLFLAVEANGSRIVTVEGLTDDDTGTGLMQAFVDHHSVQCGYCIPGMILSGDQVLRNHEHPSREDVTEGIAGNICRCTGYRKIVDAIEDAGRERS